MNGDNNVIDALNEQFVDKKQNLRDKKLAETNFSNLGQEIIIKQINDTDENNIIKERIINEKTNNLFKLLSANKMLKKSILACYNDKNKNS